MAVGQSASNKRLETDGPQRMLFGFCRVALVVRRSSCALGHSGYIVHCGDWREERVRLDPVTTTA